MQSETAKLDRGCAPKEHIKYASLGTPKIIGTKQRNVIAIGAHNRGRHGEQIGDLHVESRDRKENITES